MKNKLYIAYGSNLNLTKWQRCLTAKVVGNYLKSKIMPCFRGSGLASAAATDEPCAGSSVPVLLWETLLENMKKLLMSTRVFQDFMKKKPWSFYWMTRLFPLWFTS